MSRSAIVFFATLGIACAMLLGVSIYGEELGPRALLLLVSIFILDLIVLAYSVFTWAMDNIVVGLIRAFTRKRKE